MTQIHCSMRGIECSCTPSQCRAAPPKTLIAINKRQDDELEADFWRKLKPGLYVTGVCIAILVVIGLYAAGYSADNSFRQQQIIARV